MVTVRAVDSDWWSPQLMDIMFGKERYKQFTSNNRYAVHENNSTTYGKWSLAEKDTKLIMTSNRGDIHTFEITRITKDTLIILGKKKTFGTLVKDAGAEELNVEAFRHNNYTVPATVKQICKKWVLKDTRVTSELTEEEKIAHRMLTKAIRSTWYDFKPDGIVISQFNSLKKQKWYFENKNKSIVIVDDNNDGSVFDIISISTSQLIIQKPQAVTQFIYEVE